MAKELVLREGSSAPGGLTAPRVTVDEVLARLDRGEQLAFVDARREEEWRISSQKLPGAVRLSPEGKEETLPLIAPDRAVVTYCTCAHEASAARVAEMLMARGYKDVHPLHGGFDAWREAGGALEPRTTAR
ncbi:MAG TPA: rhodanese-like domain-containing protein [Vicinamibacteria bacterium]|nr:rhodanese-like domain-containing protein [Vicinamibacteria bacterium]